MKTNEKKGRRAQRALTAAVLALAALAGKPAMAIDVDAGDYTALPPGTNLGLLYYQHVDRDRIYARGNQVSGGSLGSDVGIARYVHYMKLGNFTVDPQFLLPFGTLRGTNNLKALGNTIGVGDLILTATGELSRNRSVGIELGKGRELSEILGSTRRVAEGVGSTAATLELARRAEVEMPIAEQVHSVLTAGRVTRDAIRDLMERRLKQE